MANAWCHGWQALSAVNIYNPCHPMLRVGMSRRISLMATIPWVVWAWRSLAVFFWWPEAKTFRGDLNVFFLVEYGGKLMHSLHCPPTPPMRKEQDVLCMEGIGQPAEGCDSCLMSPSSWSRYLHLALHLWSGTEAFSNPPLLFKGLVVFSGYGDWRCIISHQVPLFLLLWKV